MAVQSFVMLRPAPCLHHLRKWKLHANRISTSSWNFTLQQGWRGSHPFGARDAAGKHDAAQAEVTRLTAEAAEAAQQVAEMRGAAAAAAEAAAAADAAHQELSAMCRSLRCGTLLGPASPGCGQEVHTIWCGNFCGSAGWLYRAAAMQTETCFFFFLLLRSAGDAEMYAAISFIRPICRSVAVLPAL